MESKGAVMPSGKRQVRAYRVRRRFRGERSAREMLAALVAAHLRQG